ncbi:cob(I)yrinic acid a,c-diamide adenosyltransferase [Fusibacter sp. JL216-2]|uniref:cob(I)yrinic acid a,c-diamide adenosyltransferase n=1 Tax=Fusibacter sp. JL216-2 TaxID=3071453 RepID=UPI003D337E8F
MTDNRKPEDMIVYTRTGDKGKTSLYDTTNVYKDNIRVEAYGTIDELNSALGIAKHYIDDHKVQDLIHGIQRKLFDVGAELATEDTSILITRIEEDDVKFLEDTIDHYLQFFETPDYFIIPGDNKESAYLHLARTICRRAERHIVTLIHSEEINEQVLIYVNRLSDLIYTLSRYVEDNFDRVWFGTERNLPE